MEEWGIYQLGVKCLLKLPFAYKRAKWIKISSAVFIPVSGSFVI